MARPFRPIVKYLYCPKCKEFRVKAWYQRQNRCSRCLGEAAAIRIPNSWLTYTAYVLYFVVPALVAAYIVTDIRLYIWLSVISLAIMMAISYADISRGATYAKKRIKITNGDLSEFRKRGWV